VCVYVCVWVCVNVCVFFFFIVFSVWCDVLWGFMWLAGRVRGVLVISCDTVFFFLLWHVEVLSVVC